VAGGFDFRHQYLAAGQGEISVPRLSAFFIRLALLYLLAGFTIGALLLSNKGLPFWQGVWQLLPAHIEFLLFGWTVQLVFGMAYWILPRLPGGSRGRVKLAWLALILLNLGLWLAALRSIPVQGDVFLFSGRLLQALAVACFAAHSWERIRSTGRS
jgi:heme/copper-type cytochrome/quinol oxidase subunit 1